MAFNKQLLDIIACPACKGKLVLHEMPASDSGPDVEQLKQVKTEQAKIEHVLVCRFDRLAYPIDDGIPVLLESDSKLLSLEELEQVKKHD